MFLLWLDLGTYAVLVALECNTFAGITRSFRALFSHTPTSLPSTPTPLSLLTILQAMEKKSQQKNLAPTEQNLLTSAYVAFS